MPLIRLVVFLILAAIAFSFLLYFFTKDPRYVRIAWQIFKFAIVLSIVVAAFYLLEKLVLIA